jgi:enoyl-CoA hydratase
MAFQTVLYDIIDGNIARITLNRPQYRNAENHMMSREIREAFEKADEDRAVRVIILTGAGPSFSSGHDLGTPEAQAERAKGPKQHGDVEGYLFEKKRWLDAWTYVRDIGKPTIASVRGYAIMGGFMLAAMCDLIIAADDAKFADMGTRMGGAGVEVFFHPWQLGIRKCKEFMFTGDYMDAQEAWRIGFVNKVVPKDKLEEETLALAKRIAMVSPTTLRFCKQTINQAEDFMGFKNSLNSHFNIHHLVHLYTEQDPDHILAKLKDGGSVADFLHSRDKDFKKDDRKK